jgi:hypothetical protein
MKKKALFIAFLVVMGLALAACGKNTNSADEKASAVSNRIQTRYLKSQPLPEAAFSQLRQNLIEIEKAQIDTTQTSTFFFARGASGTGTPVFSCPSIGFPIPSTYQLTNPTKMDSGHDGRAATINQIEATGVFTGDSAGTYVICVDSEGDGYAVYWEGDVLAFAGPAAYDETTRRVELVGQPTVNFSTGK